MQKSAELSVSMINNLLTLARRGNYEAQPLELTHCVHEFLQSAAFKHIQNEHSDNELIVDIADDLPMILGSSTHVHQILLNIIKNAFEATPARETIKISTQQEQFNETLDGFEEVPAGDFCVIRIKDSGRGMSTKELDHIFEPFYSSKKESGRGTGLGLAMVYGMSKDLGASIEVLSEVGVGTEFIVRIPIAQSSSAENGSDLDLRGEGRVLIIDDLDIQRQLGGRMLSALGYQVDIAAGSQEALILVDKTPYDVVVSDMLLEEEDGLDVYRQLRNKLPGIPYIIASGYAESDRVNQALEEGVNAFIRIPYTQSTLGRAIKSALQ